MRTVIDQLCLVAAQLYLHSFNFLNSSDTPPRKIGVLKAYNSAVSLVSFLTAHDDLLLYLTYYHFRTLLNVACILLKVLQSSYAQDLSDYEAGRRAFNQTISALSRSSVSNTDVGGKAVRLLSQVWHSSDTSRREHPPQFIIKSRLGAR